MGNKTSSFKVQDGAWCYKQTSNSGYASPNWHARVKLPGDQRVHTRSTGTSDRREAAKRTQDFYFELVMHQRGLGPTPASLLNRQVRVEPAHPFDHVADAYADLLKQNAGQDQRKLWGVRNTKQILYAVNGLTKFFGKDDVNAISTERMREYSRFQVEHSRRGKLATGTQKKALITLGLVLKFAVEKGYLAQVPALPRMKDVDQPRAWFNKDKFRLLDTKATELGRDAERKGDKVEAERWYEMSDFVLFLVYTFLRSSEWASLQHRHIEVVEGAKPYLRIAVVKGKTRLRTGISMPNAVYVYERICRRTGGKPDTYLFLPDVTNRETARDKMRDRFEALLQANNLKRNALGQTRVIHSLRHTSLMVRVLADVDLFLLARNAGTSVDQLERFYCSHFSADMRLDELHKGVITLDLRKDPAQQRRKRRVAEAREVETA